MHTKLGVFAFLAFTAIACTAQVGPAAENEDHGGGAAGTPAGEAHTEMAVRCSALTCNSSQLHEACVDGQCCSSSTDPNPNYAICGGSCADLNADDNNCGGCGNVCKSFWVRHTFIRVYCSDGKCI